MSNFDDRNSTVRWMPRWARNLLGLNSDYDPPAYDRSSSDRQRMAEQGTGWVPGFVRSWLGLDFNEPKRYGPSSVYDPVAGQLLSGPGAGPRRMTATLPATPVRPAPVTRPASEPLRTPSAPQPAPTYRPASTGGGSTSGLDFRRDPNNSSAQGAPTTLPRDGYGVGSVTPGANLTGTPTPEGYVQPIGYLFRAYARGALPPEGLEAFTKQTRKTIEDVWEFYSYWLRFQTDELGRLGREAADAAGDALPGSTRSQQPIRRIKVTTNGESNSGPLSVAPIVPPPVVPPVMETPVVPPPVVPPADEPEKKD